jgi:hypothetical protein
MTEATASPGGCPGCRAHPIVFLGELGALA